MTDDIVARLRDHGEAFPIENASAWIDFASLYLVQAADEIERLKAALNDVYSLVPRACVPFLKTETRAELSKGER